MTEIQQENKQKPSKSASDRAKSPLEFPVLTQKTCTKCEDTLPIEYFSPDVTRKDGYRNICKECSRNYPSMKDNFVERGLVLRKELTGKTARCSKCRQVKDRAYFSKDKNKVSGYRSACKECRKKDWENYRNRRAGAA